MNSVKVFVSYTKRDGTVSRELLQNFFQYLQGICNPFIHTADSNSGDITQGYVIKELLMSHMVILIESPLVYKSPWVKLELLISRIKMMPVIKLQSRDIEVLLSAKGRFKKELESFGKP